YFDRYLRWADVLLAPPDEFLGPLGQRAIEERRRLLHQLPSWGDVAGGCSDLLSGILPNSDVEHGLPEHLTSWMAEVRTELEKMCGAAETLLGSARRLAE